MDAIGRGIIAGFIATLLLSGLFDPVATVAREAKVLHPTLGWMLHFLIGSLVWGAGFALIQPYLLGPLWVRGLTLGIGAWLVVMTAVMPLTHAGFFGLKVGLATPIVMLVVHLVYGTALGIIFSLLDPKSAPPPDEHLHPDEHLRPLAR